MTERCSDNLNVRITEQNRKRIIIIEYSIMYSCLYMLFRFMVFG